MPGFVSNKGKAAIQRRKSRKWKLILLLIVSPVFYLLGSGPALWSRSQISNKHWRKGVVYYVVPVMWLNYQLRDRSLIERVGAVDLTRSNNTDWYDSLETYWSYFGTETVSEASKITMMLKIEFH